MGRKVYFGYVKLLVYREIITAFLVINLAYFCNLIGPEKLIVYGNRIQEV